MKKHALLIGINEYDHVGKLKCARQDAIGVRDALHQYYGFHSTDEIILMTCDTRGSRYPTQNNIERQLARLRDIKDLELLLIGFWGHGFLSDGLHEDRYLCAIDTDENELVRTGIAYSDIVTKATQVSAYHTCLILDCCQNRQEGKSVVSSFSQAERDRMDTDANNAARDIIAARRNLGYKDFLPPTFAIWSSCSPRERAYELEDNGLFTSHLIEGLRLQFDSLNRLAGYVNQKVCESAWRLEKKQSPFMEIKGGGDIYFPMTAPPKPEGPTDEERHIENLKKQAAVFIAKTKKEAAQIIENAKNEAKKQADAIIKAETTPTIIGSAVPPQKTTEVPTQEKVSKVPPAVNGETVLELRGHMDRVREVAFSPDGKRVVTASADKTARIWDVESGEELSMLIDHTDTLCSASFSPDGKKIVTASADKTARIWDAKSGEELQMLIGHTGTLCSASFSPDGKRVITAGLDNIVRIWDAKSGEELQKMLSRHTHQFCTTCSASFSPDGKKIAMISGGSARILDAMSWQELQKLEGHISCATSVAFSPDGRKIVTTSVNCCARIWDANSGTELQVLWYGGRWLAPVCNSASFSPDSKKIVTTGVDWFAQIWDANSGKKLQKLEKEWGKGMIANCSIAFSPDGKKVVMAGADATARIWFLE